MQQALYNYDVYPKVFPMNEPTEITVKPLGKHAEFSGICRVSVHRLDSGSSRQEFSAWNQTIFDLSPDEDGALRFTYTASAECEHFIRVFQGDTSVVQLSVYALAPDLACRIPLRGDLHMHTFRSDGKEDPAIVCANYRRIGYDFIVITDHGRYYPSLEARSAYRDVEMELNILPGEEVHLPMTNVHIVNAGGTFSVNGLLPSLANYVDTAGKTEERVLEGYSAPAILSEEEYQRQIREIEKSEVCADCPENVDKTSYAVCVWAFQKIREAGGLGIFAHPYWISDMWQIPEAFTRYMMEKHPFDAFEVLGGESYYEQNGFQTALYYDEYRYGRVHPIVGSTDSHSSTEHNRNGAICSTIVFAHENQRTDILQSIKDKYSVAVDTISKEYRLVGEHRLQKYACFLMDNWYPIHDRIAAMDGELMREYYVGEADRAELERMSAKSARLFRKYFRTVK
ncbi:MAG: PHP domain-containing protein [Candidatus Merdivicinus sp.]